MIRVIAFVVLSELAVLVGTAACLLHRSNLFAGFRASKPFAAQRRAEQDRPPVPARVAVAPSQSAPAHVAAPPPARESVLGAYTSWEVSDSRPLVQRCVCGATAMHVAVMSSHSVCTSCCRAWSSLNGRSYLVPITMQASFAAANGLSYGRGMA